MAKHFDKLKEKKRDIKFNNPTPQSINEESHYEYVKFSFKYLISDNSSYNYTEKDRGYFCTFISRLHEVSRMKCGEFKGSYSRGLRNHSIKWEETTQKSFGLPQEEQLVDQPFQFALSVNEHGRIIGFFISMTFYVVWFDPNHVTYA